MQPPALIDMMASCSADGVVWPRPADIWEKFSDNVANFCMELDMLPAFVHAHVMVKCMPLLLPAGRSDALQLTCTPSSESRTCL